MSETNKIFFSCAHEAGIVPTDTIAEQRKILIGLLYEARQRFEAYLCEVLSRTRGIAILDPHGTDRLSAQVKSSLQFQGTLLSLLDEATQKLALHIFQGKIKLLPDHEEDVIGNKERVLQSFKNLLLKTAQNLFKDQYKKIENVFHTDLNQLVNAENGHDPQDSNPYKYGLHVQRPPTPEDMFLEREMEEQINLAKQGGAAERELNHALTTAADNRGDQTLKVKERDTWFFRLALDGKSTKDILALTLMQHPQYLGVYMDEAGLRSEELQLYVTQFMIGQAQPNMPDTIYRIIRRMYNMVDQSIKRSRERVQKQSPRTAKVFKNANLFTRLTKRS